MPRSGRARAAVAGSPTGLVFTVIRGMRPELAAGAQGAPARGDEGPGDAALAKEIREMRQATVGLCFALGLLVLTGCSKDDKGPPAQGPPGPPPGFPSVPQEVVPP